MQWRALCACMYTLLHIHTCSLQYFTSSLTQWNVSVSDLQLLLYGGVASSKFIQLLPHVAHSINKIGFQVRTHLTKVLIDLCENIIMCILVLIGCDMLNIIIPIHKYTCVFKNTGYSLKPS